MAKLTGALQMTGSIGGLSIYCMKGCTELVVRTKGGFTKERIRSDVQLQNVRNMNNEWSGVTQLAGAIRRSLILLSLMSDFNYTGQLCAIAKQVQKLTAEGGYGKRSLLLSSHREQWVGFSYNRTTSFPSIVKPLVTGTIDRINGSAYIELGEMYPTLSISSPKGVSFFRFVGVLGAVSDVVFDVNDAVYRPVDGKEETSVSTRSEWFHLDNRFEGLTLRMDVAESDRTLHLQRTLLLGIGIEFGVMGAKGIPTTTKQGGGAMLVAVE